MNTMKSHSLARAAGDRPPLERRFALRVALRVRLVKAVLVACREGCVVP